MVLCFFMVLVLLLVPFLQSPPNPLFMPDSQKEGALASLSRPTAWGRLLEVQRTSLVSLSPWEVVHTCELTGRGEQSQNQKHKTPCSQEGLNSKDCQAPLLYILLFLNLVKCFLPFPQRPWKRVKHLTRGRHSQSGRRNAERIARLDLG